MSFHKKTCNLVCYCKLENDLCVSCFSPSSPHKKSHKKSHLNLEFPSQPIRVVTCATRTTMVWTQVRRRTRWCSIFRRWFPNRCWSIRSFSSALHRINFACTLRRLVFWRSRVRIIDRRWECMHSVVIWIVVWIWMSISWIELLLEWSSFSLT